jgi:hypothetical protein
MATSTTPAEAATSRIYNSLGNWIEDFLGSHKHDAPGPQAFYVELKPDGMVEPHFHGENQYQLIVGGDGRLGKHDLRAGIFHYTDAYTPYGPLVAGPEGLKFFTLRQNAYLGHHPMPGSRELMKQKAGRNLIAVAEPGPVAEQEAKLLLDEDDGLRAYELRCAAGSRLPEIAIGGRHGSGYLIVLSGELETLGRTHPPRSTIHVDEDEELPAATAGAEGAVAVLLTFPMRGQTLSA